MADIYHFSAPGRTEIGGNHTDHQHGCVIAAAVNMETTAEVVLNGANVIRVDSEGYRPVEIDLSDLKIREEEKNTTAALIRGVAAATSSRALTRKSSPRCCPARACPARRRLRC